MAAAPQFKASGLDGGCRILADFGGRMFRPLQRRLRDELNRKSFRFFLSDAHRERWTHWKNSCYGMSERNAAALFLLTADEELWQRVLWHLDSSGFDFPAIRRSGIHPERDSIGHTPPFVGGGPYHCGTPAGKGISGRAWHIDRPKSGGRVVSKIGRGR